MRDAIIEVDTEEYIALLKDKHQTTLDKLHDEISELKASLKEVKEERDKQFFCLVRCNCKSMPSEPLARYSSWAQAHVCPECKKKWKIVEVQEDQDEDDQQGGGE